MMRGWVAISVTATPAAAPRRIREVLRMIIRGYPFHPSEQDMISAAGIKDQELTIIVSMMLIELALLRLSRFKRLALLDTQGLELLVRCIREFGGRDARDNLIGQEASFALSPVPLFPHLQLLMVIHLRSGF